MAVKTNLDMLNSSRVEGNQTNGNEDIFKMNTLKSFTVECVLVSGPGSATLKSSLSPNVPSDFTGFVSDSGGERTDSFTVNFSGVNWVGLDITSGTWETRVNQY